MFVLYFSLQTASVRLYDADQPKLNTNESVNIINDKQGL